MIFNFDTTEDDSAVAALIVYAIYRSRDKRRFKTSPEMWGQIERFVKASAKRTTNIQRFIDALMPRMSCPSINPKWMDVGINGRLTQFGNEFMAFPNAEQREFLTSVLNAADHDAVIERLYRETTWVILLVRDRLEREKPIESRFEIEEEVL